MGPSGRGCVVPENGADYTLDGPDEARDRRPVHRNRYADGRATGLISRRLDRCRARRQKSEDPDHHHHAHRPVRRPDRRRPAIREPAGSGASPSRLPAGFVVLMMIGTALDPLDDEAGIATQVGQAVGHAGHVQAMAFDGDLRPCAAGRRGPAGRRHSAQGAALANLAGVLALISAVVYPAIRLIHLVEAAFVPAGPTRATGADQFDSPGPFRRCSCCSP